MGQADAHQGKVTAACERKGLSVAEGRRRRGPALKKQGLEEKGGGGRTSRRKRSRPLQKRLLRALQRESTDQRLGGV